MDGPLHKRDLPFDYYEFSRLHIFLESSNMKVFISKKYLHVIFLGNQNFFATPIDANFPSTQNEKKQKLRKNPFELRKYFLEAVDAG